VSSPYDELLGRGATRVVSHEALDADATVVGLVRDGAVAGSAGAGSEVEVVLDTTPFYAESGGQEADAGRITGDGLDLEVLDVQKPVKGLVTHTVRVLSGTLAPGLAVRAEVDRDWRLGACQAHSATHILHAALRQVLGPSALQAGSYNKPGSLRLDFAWSEQLSPETRSEVEDVANRAVRADLPVRAFFTSLPKARELGALALFDETYDEDVRVVEIGGDWSRELCGGTHVAHSSQVGPLAITAEASVKAGQRRVEALVGLDYLAYVRRQRGVLDALTGQLRVPVEEIPDRVSSMADRLRAAEKELERLRAEAVLAGAAALAGGAADVAGVAVVAAEVPGAGGGDLRTLALDVRDRLGDRPGLVALASGAEGKVTFVVATNGPARERGLSAGAVVRGMAPPVGGRGGGKDDMAQGGGTEPGGIAESLRLVARLVGEQVGA
jgi:alanyl-tRNA synthetase